VALIKNILFIVPNFLILIPMVFSLIYFKKNRIEFNYLTFYLTLSGITQIVSFIYWLLQTNNYPILHIYTPIEAFLLIYFFSILLKGVISKFIFIFLFIFIVGFCALDSFMLENIYTSNTYSRSIEALIIISLSVLWYIKIVSESGVERAKYVGVNYIVAGLLIYFSGSLLLFSYSSYIQEMALQESRNLWTFHTLLFAQLSILITIGLWKARSV
jgi:hypothetical protein